MPRDFEKKGGEKEGKKGKKDTKEKWTRKDHVAQLTVNVDLSVCTKCEL